MEKDARKEQNSSKGAEAALPRVTRGKLEKCPMRAVGGKTGHAVGQVAPSSLPVTPHPALPWEGAAGPLRGPVAMSQSRLCQEWGRGLPSALGDSRSPAPWCLTTPGTPLAQPQDRVRASPELACRAPLSSLSSCPSWSTSSSAPISP